MAGRTGLAAALVCGLLFATAAITYGERPSEVGWRFDVRDARWVEADPFALLADLIVAQVGSGPAHDVRLWIRYPRELFDLTDLHPPRDEWLPFLGGQAIPRWDPGRARRFEFGFRCTRQSAPRTHQLLSRTDLRVEWRERGERRSLVVPLPPLPPPPPPSPPLSRPKS